MTTKIDAYAKFIANQSASRRVSTLSANEELNEGRILKHDGFADGIKSAINTVARQRFAGNKKSKAVQSRVFQAKSPSGMANRQRRYNAVKGKANIFKEDGDVNLLSVIDEFVNEGWSLEDIDAQIEVELTESLWGRAKYYARKSFGG